MCVVCSVSARQEITSFGLGDRSSCLIAAGDGSSRGQAGAVAAAARELRPVEIVGLYEEQKDRAEVMHLLFACTSCHGSEQSNSGPSALCNFLLAFEEMSLTPC